MGNRCPDCGNILDFISFYEGQGMYFRACCTFCGFSIPANDLCNYHKEEYLTDVYPDLYYEIPKLHISP